MDQKTQFIADYLREVLSITELCELYGISRKTGYKWIDRYIHNGPAGLEEYSRRPHQTPNQTAPRLLKHCSPYASATDMGAKLCQYYTSGNLTGNAEAIYRVRS
jgi:transposase-like protein